MLALAVARHLHAKQLIIFAEGDAGIDGNAFLADMPSAPDVAVAITPSGGFGQPTKAPTDLPTVQLRARGARYDAVTPYRLLRALYDELTCLDHSILDAGGDDEVFVIGCTALQSDPASLGLDENQRHEFTQNFAFRVASPSAHRPGSN